MCFNTPRGPSGFIYELGRELLRRQGRSDPVRIVPLARMVGRIPEREQEDTLPALRKRPGLSEVAVGMA